jgi:hypothetical protein
MRYNPSKSCQVSFLILMAWRGLFAAELVAPAVSVLGLIVTFWMLPETKGKSLEELNLPEAPSAAPATLTAA